MECHSPWKRHRDRSFLIRKSGWCFSLPRWFGWPSSSSSEISRPWINGPDFNGAVWSQSAHNILRAGLGETSGASSGFYFGPLPIPPQGYYLHHPPLLHLVIAILFAVLGEHEWVARLVPVGCSLASAVFLWLLVRNCLGTRTASLCTAVFAVLPMELRYGSMVNFEPCVLMLMLGTLWCLRWHRVSGMPGWRYGALAFVVTGLWVDWAMYLFVVGLCACWLLRSKDGDRRFAGIICLSALLSGALYLLRIALLQPDAWKNLANIFMFRLGTGKGGHFTELQWLARTADIMVAHFLPVGLILGAIGIAILWRGRARDEGLRWIGRACLSVLVMDALFVGVFQNDSFIHQVHRVLFSLSAFRGRRTCVERPDRTAAKIEDSASLPGIAELSACLVLGVIGVVGFHKTNALVHQFRILDYSTDEPRI